MLLLENPAAFYHVIELCLIVCGQGPLKRWVPFAGDIVSVLSLWYKRAPKSSYKKYRFALLSENCSCPHPCKNSPFCLPNLVPRPSTSRFYLAAVEKNQGGGGSFHGCEIKSGRRRPEYEVIASLLLHLSFT